jgi:hypothetical protein
MEQHPSERDYRDAHVFAASLTFRGKPITELPDSAHNIIEGLAKEFAAQRRAAFKDGLRAGVRRFAWWKDGVQNVGTTGKTLPQALSEIDAETIE